MQHRRRVLATNEDLQWMLERSTRCQYGRTDQVVELMLKPLVENARILPDGVSNIGFGGWDRKGDLISERRNGTRDGVSTASPSKKEKTTSKCALGFIVFGNGLC